MGISLRRVASGGSHENCLLARQLQRFELGMVSLPAEAATDRRTTRDRASDPDPPTVSGLPSSPVRLRAFWFYFSPLINSLWAILNSCAHLPTFSGPCGPSQVPLVSSLCRRPVGTCCSALFVDLAWVYVKLRKSSPLSFPSSDCCFALTFLSLSPPTHIDLLPSTAASSTPSAVAHSVITQLK